MLWSLGGAALALSLPSAKKIPYGTVPTDQFNKLLTGHTSDRLVLIFGYCA